MGVHFEADGLPRIAGRIFGLFILEGQPLSFGALADRLSISRASVSTNTRLLARMGLIDRIAVSGERQDYFRMADAPYARLLGGMAERARKAAQTATKAEKALAAAGPDARRRLRGFAEFQNAVATAASGLADNLQMK